MTPLEDLAMWYAHRAAVAKARAGGANYWEAQQAGFRATDKLERINRKACEKKGRPRC